MPLDSAEITDEPETITQAEPDKGRGVAPKKGRTAETRTAKRVTGRTIYIPDELWERVIVQSHRRNKTYSEFIVGILERQIPDHRVGRGADESAA